jgi:hypothetical protein
MASHTWVAERVMEWLREDPTMGPSKLKNELLKKYKIDVPYDRVFRSREKALDMIYGVWDDSYDLLPTYMVELLKAMPRSVVEIDTEEHKGAMCFQMFFVALKPCIDDFFARVQTIHCHGLYTLDRKIQRAIDSYCYNRWPQLVISSGIWSD